ncbi:MAG: Fic family protein [Eggerthellales bacterium]|nr:Fic family protein [Eggerthellales bacterium]
MQFCYDQILKDLMTPKVIAALGSVREHRGKQQVFQQLQPQELNRLCEVAKIQSIGASNRIENICTTTGRLQEIAQEKTEPRNRDEREIAGYRHVLNTIHESHDDIPVTPGVILQLHRDLYRYEDAAFAGHFKDSDNVIAERNEAGDLQVRFKPTSAAATPAAMQRICQEYRDQISEGTYDPLLVSLVFAFDFVSIHPFNDGNGRMSRLITLLLMYRAGYTVGKYISVEAEIETSKDAYYEALAASSVGWETGTNTYEPFVLYMLGVILACYRKLTERMQLTAAPLSHEDQIRRYFDTLLGAASKARILQDNPNMSMTTLNRILQKLQAEGFIQKVGAARATQYKRARDL